MPISQTDLGAAANASRKQVNAAVAHLAARGWIAHSHRNIRMLDPEDLLRFAADEALP